MKTAGYMSVFGGFLFAALSAGGTHHSLNEITASAGLQDSMNVSWREIISLVLMLAGGILLLLSRGKEKEPSLQ